MILFRIQFLSFFGIPKGNIFILDVNNIQAAIIVLSQYIYKRVLYYCFIVSKVMW